MDPVQHTAGYTRHVPPEIFSLPGLQCLKKFGFVLSKARYPFEGKKINIFGYDKEHVLEFIPITHAV